MVIGNNTIALGATLEIQNKSTNPDHSFFVIKLNNGDIIQKIDGNGVIDYGKNISTNRTTYGVNYKSLSSLSGRSFARYLDWNNNIIFDISGDRASSYKPIYINNPVSNLANALTIRSSSSLSGNDIVNILNSSNNIIVSIDGDNFIANQLGSRWGNPASPSNFAHCFKSQRTNSSPAFWVDNGSNLRIIELRGDRNILMPGLPTSDPLVAGSLWNDSGTVKISAG